MRFLSDNLDFVAGFFLLLYVYAEGIMKLLGVDLMVTTIHDAETRSIFEYQFALLSSYHITIKEVMEFTAWLAGWAAAINFLLRKVKERL